MIDGLTVTTMTLAEAIDKLAAEPLIAHPGAAWNYSLATDVLGRVIEVASGQPFQVFLRNRIFKEGKTYFSGGAGLVSTARDYARFAQMLLNGGVLDGARLLSPKTMELMTASHTADLPPSGLIGGGAHFGLGFRVVTDVATTQTLGSNGSFGWSGIYGTNFWVDPKERMVAIVMVQRYPGSPVAAAFQPLVYQALVR